MKCPVYIVDYYSFNVFEVYQISRINAKFNSDMQLKYGKNWHETIKAENFCS